MGRQGERKRVSGLSPEGRRKPPQKRPMGTVQTRAKAEARVGGKRLQGYAEKRKQGNYTQEMTTDRSAGSSGSVEQDEHAQDPTTKNQVR